MPLPFRLEEGLYFEDTGSLLPWFASFNMIRLLDDPIIDEKKAVIEWRDKRCFGGKVLDVIIASNDYTNQASTLEVIDFSFNKTAPRETFKIFSLYFEKFLGKPSESQDDGYGRQTVLWNCNDIQLIVGVGERFVEFEIFSINRGINRWNLNTR